MKPQATTQGQFRTELVGHGLWERVLGEVNRQLELKGVVITVGRRKKPEMAGPGGKWFYPG